MLVPLKYIKVEHRPVHGTKLLDQADQFLGIELGKDVFFFGKGFRCFGKVQDGTQGRFGPQPLQGAVDHDTAYPGLESAFAAELVDHFEYLHKTFLQNLLCFFPAFTVAQAYGEEPGGQYRI